MGRREHSQKSSSFHIRHLSMTRVGNQPFILSDLEGDKNCQFDSYGVLTQKNGERCPEGTVNVKNMIFSQQEQELCLESLKVLCFLFQPEQNINSHARRLWESFILVLCAKAVSV